MTTDVDSVIADARIYASEVLTGAGLNISNALTVIDGLRSGSEDHIGPITIAPPLPGDAGDVPQYAGPHFEFEAFTGVRPTLQSAPSLTFPADPGDAPSVATYNPPTQPSGDADTSLLANVPSVDVDIVVPDSPDLLGEIRGIVAPALLSLTMPVAPTYVAPEFTATRPTFDVVAPTNLDDTMRDQYEDISPVMRDAITNQVDAFLDREFPSYRAGMAAIETRLQTYLDGGSALSPAVEDAMYNRTLDKTNADARRATSKSWSDASRAGFTLPGPILVAANQAVDQERRSANARANIEIYIKQAELEQTNLQFAVTASIGLRKVAIDSALAYYTGLVQINGQAVEYARSVVDAVVKTFDIAARYSEVQTRIYESEARVYEAKLKGAMSAIEVYTAEIRGLEAQANVNQAQVNAYRARLEAVQAEATVYKSHVDAIVSAAQLEKIKVDIYSARVSAYVAQVNGVTERWHAYEAAVRGEGAKIQASAESVRAYQAQVSAYGERVRAKVAEIDGIARVNESVLKAYQTDVEVYATKNKAQSEAVSAEVNSFDATIKAFMAKANAISDRSRADIAHYEAVLHGIISEAQLHMEHLREVNKLNVARVEASARVSVAGADVYGRTAQAALSGMNTLVAASQTQTS